ncbi:uncharacterized protein LOC108599956 [Drosophila busckii]|uniref:uncharacterized protein LOC108599956 n=1 Tax=Drosophila busckii TaxID=30019 RepID=UPI00083F3E99|nr:uncharacterized protein LOC108599956 [Drosophila busckii]
MKNECDTNRGAVPKQALKASTTTNASAAQPLSTNTVTTTTTTNSSRSSISRARNLSLKKQQEQLERERERESTNSLQRGSCKAIFELLERASVTKSQQQQREALRQLAAEHSYDPTADQLQEQQQRYCFPVRPVQRVQHQQQPTPATVAVLRKRQSTTATTPNATVGVVTPHTTNGSEEQSLSSSSNSSSSNNHSTALQTLVNRLFSTHSSHQSNAVRSQVDILRTLLGLDENWNTSASGQQTADTLLEQLNNMVHENNPSTTSERDEGIVNSTSLEDVPISELSDNRAQSIQSLHSVMDTPTPDTTPSFDDLQQRLDASNRNMQHLQQEQAKLLNIQNMAKTHLNEMEQLRQQTARLPHNGEAPNYESVQQVQDDMASLVGRMKNLTAFIHNQNELSNVLGDDGPEIMAEQQALQEKLESLRTQREDMRNLVDELNSINRTARETAQRVRESSEESQEAAPVVVKSSVSPKPSNERVVPVEYQRNVPIIRQEAANAAQRALQAQTLINQKTADIDALKAQMARLKNMLNTVTQIEENTPSVGEALETRQNVEIPMEITQRVHQLNDVTSELRAEAASLQQERDRILALKAEIERRKQQAAAAVQMGDEALKRSSLTPTPTPMRQREMELQQQQSLEDLESTRHVPTREELHAQCQQLRQEYEQKQREYELRYVNNDHGNNHCSSSNNNSHNNNTTSEADDEGNDDTDSDRYFAHARTASAATLKRAPSASTVVEQQIQQQQQLQQQQQQPPSRRHQHKPQAAPHSLSNNEEELNMTMDSLSLGNDSIQSSSTRSQYMPPPMAPVQGMWNTHNGGNAWLAAPAYAPVATAPQANAAGSSNASSSNATPDAVLMQQFMQTQQMLINSVCQCNQTLWHQQREIDSLNSQLHVLQDRLQEQSYGLRSESMPPPAALGQMPSNNLCLGGTNRAQSEQLYSFGAASHQSAFSNYQRSSHRNNIYGSADAHQQQTYLNNAVPPPPPPPPAPQPTSTTHYNNETPLSPNSYRASPGPIFMNHHNNTIHQNNANLRTQNHHANNLHSLPEDAVPPPTLNNQVPPGNRANNYWDNFRSYTRQNLLSNKSNEELNMEQQYRQMQRQRQRPSYFSAGHLPHSTRSSTSSMLLQQPHVVATPPQQQQHRFYESPQQPPTHNSSSRSNNLNNSSTSRDWTVDDVDVEENNDAAIYSSSRRRNQRHDEDAAAMQQQQQQQLCSVNMNVNSPLYQRNKVPAKPSTSAVSLTPLQQRHLRFDFELPPHMQILPALPPAQLPIPPWHNVSSALEPMVANEAHATAEQHEETASEELNRNLLVNALKNDKFTTKFYESIKEDVYRRLERLFEQQQQQQQQQFQQQPQFEINQSQSQPAEIEPTESTESGNATPQHNHNARAEHEPIASAAIEAAGEAAAAVVSDNDEQIIEVVIEQAAASTSAASTEVTPDHELIEYIIKRIRNQTHNNTIINDSLLAEVSKLTANAAQNSAAQWTPHAASPLISPKRIYAKIKKMDVPRQRDDFLCWYRSYLEQLFVVEQPRNGCKRKIVSKESPDSSNDADLAEADQKKAECENNENPDEEANGAAAAASTNSAESNLD